MITHKRLCGGRHVRLKRPVCHLQYYKQGDSPECDNAINPPDYERVVYQNGGDLHQWRSAHEDILRSHSGLVYPVCEVL